MRTSLPPAETLFNWGLGVTLLAWGIRHAAARSSDLSGGPVTPTFVVVQCALLGLTIQVAILLLRREPVSQQGSWFSVASALPTIALGGILSDSAPPSSWTFHSALLVGGGTVLTSWTFGCLGRSFSVLPARRTTVCSGPYRWLRHPGYAGELLVLAGFALSTNSLMGVILWVFTAAWTVPRVLAEERLLLQCPRYQRYVKATPYRLMPGVF